MKRNETSDERCSYCNHLWRWHKTERESAFGAYYSCSQCYMREDKGPGFIKKGTRLGSHPWHTRRDHG